MPVLADVTAVAHDPALIRKPESVMFKEKLLTERWVPEASPGHSSALLPKFYERCSEATRVARIEADDNVEHFRMISAIFGFDVIVGKDKFFNVASWWSFRRIERGSLLAASLKRLQQMGSIAYFIQLSDSKHLKAVQARAEQFLLKSQNSNNAKHNIKGGSSEDVAVTLHDTLLMESFALLVYGQTTASLVFVTETFLKFIPTLICCARFKRSWKNVGKFVLGFIRTAQSFTQHLV